MSPSTRPKPPTGLQQAGSALWRRMQAALPADLQFSAKECELLRRACALADRETALKALLKKDGLTSIGSTGQTTLHPAVAELRQVEAALVRTLGMVSVADTAGKPVTPSAERASKAAQVRWAHHNELEARRKKAARG